MTHPDRAGAQLLHELEQLDRCNKRWRELLRRGANMMEALAGGTGDRKKAHQWIDEVQEELK